MMNEPPARRSHTTVWIVAMAAVAVLYVLGYPWAFFGWQNFARTVPDWLYQLGRPWFKLAGSPGLEHGLETYWNWTNFVCLTLKDWVDTL